MGPGADAVSLQASLNGLWQRTRRAIDTTQRQQQQEEPQNRVVQLNGLHTEHSRQQQQQTEQQSGQLASSFSDCQARDLLLQWHMANIEFANASCLRCLSMRHWDLDDVHEHQGAHVFLPGQHLVIRSAELACMSDIQYAVDQAINTCMPDHLLSSLLTQRWLHRCPTSAAPVWAGCGV